MNKVPFIIATVVALGGGVFGFVRLNEVSAEKAALEAKLAAQEKTAQEASGEFRKTSEELALLKENNERLKKERDDAKKRSKELEGAVANGDAVASAGNDGAPGDNGGGRRRGGGGDMRERLLNFAKQLDDPESRKMMTQGQSRMINRAYERLLGKLALSEQDAKLVTDLLAERNISAMDKGRQLLEGAGDDASLAAVKKEVEGTKAEYDAKLKSVLGEEKFKELSTYEATMGDRRVMDFADRNFERKSVPLQPQQKEALAAIMKEERLKNPTNEIPDIGGGPGPSMLLNDAQMKEQRQQEEDFQKRVLSRASTGLLTPDQVPVLQDSFNQRNEWRQFGRQMGQNFMRRQ